MCTNIAIKMKTTGEFVRKINPAPNVHKYSKTNEKVIKIETLL